MPSHPCGALPVTQINVHVSYCWQHQAYHAQLYTFDEDGYDDTIEATYDGHQLPFGPFDSWDDVYQSVASQLRKVMAANARRHGDPGTPMALRVTDGKRARAAADQRSMARSNEPRPL
jgi:hypothetical protein